MSISSSYSSNFDEKYKKSKSIVKKWEVEFRKQNKRTPTKVDISVASHEVKEYYKLYWNLKTQLLAETILEDSKNATHFKKSRSDSVLREHTNILPDDKGCRITSISGHISLCEGKTQCLKNLEEVNRKETWGSHLNRSRTVEDTTRQASQGLICSQNISDKLFVGTKFKKRNPRKASWVMKTKSSVMCTEDAPSPMSEMLLSPSSNASVMEDCTPGIKALITNKIQFSPVFASQKFHIISDTCVQGQSVSLVHQAVKEPLSNLKSQRKLDVEWLDRCTESYQEPYRASDSGIESMESSTSSLQTANSKTDDSPADDDIIEESDNEDVSEGHLSFMSCSQKRKLDAVLSPSDKINEIKEDEDDIKLSDLANICKKVKTGDSVLDFNWEPKSYTNQASQPLMVKKNILSKKIEKGTLNENYVKINLKKKVFVRGKKTFNFSKHKKQQWRKKKKGLEDDKEVGGLLRCFKCGDVGHYARYCQKMSKDKLLPEDEVEVEEEDSPLPTLEDAKTMALEAAPEVHSRMKYAAPVEDDDPNQFTGHISHVESMYKLADDGCVIPTPPSVFEALNKFGHYKFRPGQEHAIMRILSGQSTLLAISTGGGKSLCYQLPAYMYAARSRCITLVVSPLVSLMEDQVSGSSNCFKLGCLHTNQTSKQRETVMEDVKTGKLSALLVSPEAIVSSDSSGAFGSLLRQLPPIAFACIDEVHCVSQWSHNFRPSYLMVNKVLREKYGVKTILGLTATASKTTIAGVVRELRIPGTDGVIKDSPLPSNLCLSVSTDADKDQALLRLLKGQRFCDASAILVYCTRRDECERLAVLIRTVHRDLVRPEQVASKRLSWNAEAYHAGMSSSRRKQVQRAFMAGNLRIVVATVAFGMGINKSDIRGVIHYNMPKDLESYVQEVGRAGRDGQLAHCHLFLGSQCKDLCELRRHVHSNSVDRHSVRKLLQRVFSPCECPPEGPCSGHEVAFDCNSTVQALDLPEENIYTLLCYLELHPRELVKVLTAVYSECKIQSYNGARALGAAARKCPPLAVACAMNPKATSTLTFDVVQVARCISWDSGVVKRQLKKLEWTTNKEGKWRRSGIMVELAGLSFHVTSKGNLTSVELDEALEYLVARVTEQEERATKQLQVVCSVFSHFATSSCHDSMDHYDKERSDGIKTVIRNYFETEELDSVVPLVALQGDALDEEMVAADVRRLVCTYRDNTFNGRAVARIFHGIQSPNYPASLWYRCAMWRAHVDKDFNAVVRIATREILRLK